MKKQFIKYLKNEINGKKQLILSNAISDEDKTLVQSAIDNLTSILAEVESSTDESGVEELKSTVESLNEALTAVQEKLNQSKQDVTPNESMNYLKSKNAVHDFCNVIRNSKSSVEYRNNWNAQLLKNGITITTGSEAAYLPEAVKGLINDVWDRNAMWLNKLTSTGAKRFYVRHNTSDQTAETSRAKGWSKGDTKAAQTLTLSAKLLEPQFIYKIQGLDVQTQFENDDNLLNYIMTELTDQILYEIKRAILVGDGRESNSDYAITSLESICASSTTNYVTVSTVTSGGFLIDDMVNMVANIKNPNNKEVIAFMSQANLNTLRKVVASSTATPVYQTSGDIAATIGVSEIITTDLLGATYTAAAFIPSEYYLVGENMLAPTLYSWHEGLTNTDYWRYECAVGGGLNALKSGSVLKTA